MNRLFDGKFADTIACAEPLTDEEHRIDRIDRGLPLVCEPGRTGCPDPRGSNRTTGLTKFQRVASCRVMR